MSNTVTELTNLIIVNETQEGSNISVNGLTESYYIKNVNRISLVLSLHEMYKRN